ncbi:MAG TPA: VOC family protein [Kineosporiaceae bacterium]|nr:VOC family protein [Kineosporiaceae bacterium]
MRLALDHVILAVPDLGTAAAGLEQVLGLRATPGGRHPALGTENALVPLGGAYLELVAVADERAAATTAFGRSALAARADGPRFTGWVARADQLPEPSTAMSRETPDGTTITWRMAQAERLGDGGVLPALLAWDDESTAPPFAEADHPAGRVVLDGVEIGDPDGELASLPAVARLHVETSEPRGIRCVRLLAGGHELIVTPTVVRGPGQA